MSKNDGISSELAVWVTDWESTLETVVVLDCGVVVPSLTLSPIPISDVGDCPTPGLELK